MSAPRTPSLGRLFFGHDEQSRRYGVRPELPSTVTRKDTWWSMPSGPFPLDQGAEGACTGYGFSHELAAGPITIPGVDHAFAERRYRRNREVDEQMGNGGSDGATVLATMKAGQADGYISGYRWAFGVDDIVDTLCSVGPVVLGIEWTQGMYTTGGGGLVQMTGPVVGGHCIPLLGYCKHVRFGECVVWLNSWGNAYGVGLPELGVRAGVGFVQLGTLDRLIKDQGEAVIPADFLAKTPSPNPAPIRPPRRRRWWQFGQ